MADEDVTRNLEGMNQFDFTGWNEADWDGVFARDHTTTFSWTFTGSRGRTAFRNTSTP